MLRSVGKVLSDPRVALPISRQVETMSKFDDDFESVYHKFHIPLTGIQRGILAVGSSVMALVDRSYKVCIQKIRRRFTIIFRCDDVDSENNDSSFNHNKCIRLTSYICSIIIYVIIARKRIKKRIRNVVARVLKFFKYR